MLTSILLVASCSKETRKEASPEDIIVIVGDSALTVQSVLTSMPDRLSPSDSTALFRKIVDNWIKSMVLLDMMDDDPDGMARVEKMVENYRNRLLISEYVNSRRSSRLGNISESSIRKYYDTHRDELLLEYPLVKGIYLRIPDNTDNIDDLRRWVFSASDKSVDKIEKYGLDQASQYDYFVDRWVDWKRLSEFIPYDFFDPDAFLASTKDFETSYGGNTYLVHITDYIPSGEPMPYEFASRQIEEILYRQSSRDYEEGIIRDLCRDAEKEGRLKIVKDYTK